MRIKLLFFAIVLSSVLMVSCSKSNSNSRRIYLDSTSADFLATIPPFNSSIQELSGLLGKSQSNLATYLKGHKYRVVQDDNGVVLHYDFQTKFSGFSDTSTRFLVTAKLDPNKLISDMYIVYVEGMLTPTPSTYQIKELALTLDSTLRKNTFTRDSLQIGVASGPLTVQKNMDSTLNAFVNDPTMVNYRISYNSNSNASAYIQKMLLINLFLKLSTN